MSIICFTPYMYAIVKIWVNKCIIQGKECFIVEYLTSHIVTAVIVTRVHCCLTAAEYCYVMRGTIEVVDKSVHLKSKSSLQQLIWDQTQTNTRTEQLEAHASNPAGQFMSLSSTIRTSAVILNTEGVTMLT